MFFNKKAKQNVINNYVNENINDSAYGGFMVSKNVCANRPIRYTYREKSSNENLNGWTIYSCDDTQEYVNNPDNFVILSATSINKINPLILKIFDAPYGTDLCWVYDKKGKFTGFYDLKDDKDTTLEEILNRNSIS